MKRAFCVEWRKISEIRLSERMTQAAVWARRTALIGQKLGSCSAPWSQYSELSHIFEAISDVFLKTVQDALNLISFSWEMSESDISLRWWYAYRFDGFFRGMHGNLSTLYANIISICYAVNSKQLLF